jgi:hypothetical protein
VGAERLERSGCGFLDFVVTRLEWLAAGLFVAIAVGALFFSPAKRVGVDWEHHMFMLRDDQGPIIWPEPHGPIWYSEPRKRGT